MSEINYYEVVKKLIGPIQPVGESHTDNIRYENLQELTGLIDDLLGDISRVRHNKSRVEYSMKRAGEYCNQYLEELRQIT